MPNNVADEPSAGSNGRDVNIDRDEKLAKIKKLIIFRPNFSHKPTPPSPFTGRPTWRSTIPLNCRLLRVTNGHLLCMSQNFRF